MRALDLDLSPSGDALGRVLAATYSGPDDAPCALDEVDGPRPSGSTPDLATRARR